MLLGIYYLYKNTNINNLNSLVNSFDINPRYLKFIIESLTFDSGLDELIEKELYQILLDIQLNSNLI